MADDFEDSSAICGATTYDNRTCEEEPINGTGKCHKHGGAGGAPIGNGNAVKHGLYGERETFVASLDEEERQYLRRMYKTLQRRCESDRIENEILRNLSIDVLRVRKANSWIAKNGAVRDDGKGLHGWVRETRKLNDSIHKRAHGLGIIPPKISQ